MGALLSAIGDEVRLAFTFAWPIEPGDARAMSPDALEQMVEAEHELFYVPANHRLHGKVYVFDETHVVVSSANLTRRGMGLHAQPNAEIGFATSEPNLVEDVQAWLDELPRHRLTHDALARLRAWIASGTGAPPPSPAAELPRDRAVVEQALTRAKRAGAVRWFGRIPQGAGRNAFEIEIPGVKGALTLRAKVTEAADHHWSPAYHFELTPKDAAVEGLNGLVLVPVDRQRRLLPETDVPVLFLPWDRVVGRKLNQLRLGELRSVSRGGRRVSFERDVDGWNLRARKVLFDLQGCENSTTAFREYYR